SAAGAATRLSETGSTLLYPILTVWIERFAPTEPGVRVDAAPTGSGVGIASAISGSAQIGGSDAYLSDAQMKANDLLNVPLAVSAQEIDYNVPELRDTPPLHLSGPVLAGMYDGSIPRWDDPQILALNPGRTLPHHAIVPIHRNDGAGDTFIFTQYLSFTAPSWDQTVHYGTLVRWPANKRAAEGTGNAGMIDTASHAPYSIAYVGISYAERARSEGLAVAALQNRSGAFVLPTTDATLATAEAVAKAVPDDGRISMIYTPGASAYPLVNFEYAIVKVEQRAPGAAAALRDFLDWVIAPDQGNDAATLASVHFAPLPDHVRDIAKRLIASIAGP
ncbi:MAG TPA: phosphate ABC transporter substrate-binding protein PstS, partial [Candidatus Lustribacter sp.]|nr:phosphate ABC transporter substrate-binding protein PstS [Candidatus Lustribacter sp.]